MRNRSDSPGLTETRSRTRRASGESFDALARTESWTDDGTVSIPDATTSSTKRALPPVKDMTSSTSRGLSPIMDATASAER